VLILFTFFIIAVYPLGKILLTLSISKQRLYPDILLSLVLGLVAITLESYCLNLTAPVVIVQSLIFWLLIIKFKLFPTIARFNSAILTIILLSTYISSLLVVPFGHITNDSISLPGAHFIDSTWHLSLINSLLLSNRPDNPLFSSQKLTNYHYFVDLQIATISRLTSVPAPQLYFQFIGPIYFLLLASSTYLLARSVFKSQISGVFAIIFVNISSNLYYLVKYVYPNSYPDPSLAWIDFFSTKSVNYPLTFSLIVLNIVMYFLLFAKKNNFSVIVISLIVTSLVGFKLYAAVVLWAGLGILSVVTIFRKDFYYFKILAISLFGGYLLLKSTFNSGSGSLIIYPFWFVKTMYESPFHLNHPDWELKRQFFLSIRRLPGLIKLYLTGFLTFISINFGPLLLGLFGSVLNLKTILQKKLNLLFVIIFLSGLVIAMTFIYRYTAIVTIQFAYYSLVASAFLTSYTIAIITKKSKLLGLAVGIIIMLILMPGVTFQVNYFHAKTDITDFPPEIVRATLFLKKLSQGTILLDPVLRNGSFIPAYSQKPVYLGESIITNSLNLDSAYRVKRTINIFSCSDENFSQLTYIMSQTPHSCLDKEQTLQKIFQEGNISIYKVI
jgi:hypothetical protein